MGGERSAQEDYVLPALRRMEKKNAYGVYFIFKSMEQGRTFRISVPKYETKDPNHRILGHQRSRFTHYYFYVRDEVLGPIVMRVASFFPFHTTYYLLSVFTVFFVYGFKGLSPKNALRSHSPKSASSALP